jgi:short subunit fatty acids transporter
LIVAFAPVAAGAFALVALLFWALPQEAIVKIAVRNINSFFIVRLFFG